jgi:hypothetical protein
MFLMRQAWPPNPMMHGLFPQLPNGKCRRSKMLIQHPGNTGDQAVIPQEGIGEQIPVEHLSRKRENRVLNHLTLIDGSLSGLTIASRQPVGKKKGLRQHSRISRRIAWEVDVPVIVKMKNWTVDEMKEDLHRTEGQSASLREESLLREIAGDDVMRNRTFVNQSLGVHHLPQGVIVAMIGGMIDAMIGGTIVDVTEVEAAATNEGGTINTESIDDRILCGMSNFESTVLKLLKNNNFSRISSNPHQRLIYESRSRVTSHRLSIPIDHEVFRVFVFYQSLSLLECCSVYSLDVGTRRSWILHKKFVDERKRKKVSRLVWA